jgi:ribosomal protein S18
MNKRPLFEGDVLTANGIDIDAEYKNIALLSTFINNIGQVLPTRKTGISRESQYRVVKAINRAVAFGIIPKTRKHWSLTPRE